MDGASALGYAQATLEHVADQLRWCTLPSTEETMAGRLVPLVSTAADLSVISPKRQQ
ncbi:MAG TPA: hypothetical protein VEJ84_16650 [Acidimicrobiales bacterium]|nr:hypothetical protein [Acidimicrobiales bacterium]